MNYYCWRIDSQTAENWYVLSIYTMKTLTDRPLMNNGLTCVAFGDGVLGYD